MTNYILATSLGYHQVSLARDFHVNVNANGYKRYTIVMSSRVEYKQLANPEINLMVIKLLNYLARTIFRTGQTFMGLAVCTPWCKICSQKSVLF